MDQKYTVFYWEDAEKCVHHWNYAAKQWDTAWPDAKSEAWWIENPEVLPDSDPKHLCGLCRHINFELLLRDPSTLSSICSHGCHCIDLGPLAHTLQRPQCAFCRLIIRNSEACQKLPAVHPDSSVRLSVVATGSFGFPRLRIRLSHDNTPQNEIKDYFIQEIGNDPGQGRIVSTKIDRFLPRSWIDLCEFSHAKFGIKDGDWGSLGIGLDFIDTRDNCIATVLRCRRYTALSYVWGGNQSVQLNSQTERLLRSSGGLQKVSLPETIRDAVRLTKGMGIRYLWVDALCIVQDDKRRRDRLLARMGWIYENATVTIVAASNKSARQGLAGVKSVPRNISQITEDFQNAKFAAVINAPENPLENVKNTPWSTRGWTFQEGLLSRRLLYLTSQQMIFVCKHATFFEDTHEPSTATQEKTCIDGAEFNNEDDTSQHSTEEPPSDNQQGLLQDDGWRWDTYCQLVDEYSQRQFTYDEDVFPAMAGIQKRLNQNLPTKYLFNLPETEMDEALLWQPKGNVVRRILESGEHLPSWSWAAWNGSVTYGEMGLLQKKSSADGSEHLLWPIVSVMKWLVEDSGSMEEIEISSQDFRLQNWKLHGWKNAQFRHARQYYYHDQLPGHRFLHPVALTANQKPKVSLSRNSGALCFMALCGNVEFLDVAHERLPGSNSLSAIIPQSSESRNLGWTDIFDTTGFWIGAIKLMTSRHNYSTNLQLVALSKWHAGDRFDVAKADFEEPGTNLELDNAPRVPDHPDVNFNDTNRVFFDERKYRNGIYTYYNVMAVEWVDGSAYRIGLGKVHIAGFASAAPEWKRIELR